MKKVIICVPNLGTGGAEKFVVDIAQRLDKGKYQVIVAQTRGNIDSIFRKELERAHIRVVDLSSESYLKMLHKQIEFFRKERPDVVHTNIGSLLHVMLSCKLCRIHRRIYTVHNEAKLLFGNSRIRKLIYKLAFSFFGFVPVAICPTVKQTLIDEMGLKDSDIPIIGNGVDIKRFKPVEKKEKTDLIRIISVGTLYWIKNQEMIIRAVCALKEKRENVELLLLGEGDNRAKLEKIVEEHHAKSYIFMPGIRNNVEDYLNESDIYVSASKTEGLPLSILEAMASGLPVVATNAGGTKDIVINGTNGYLVPLDDVNFFEQSIASLCHDTAVREKFSTASRMIAEKWSIDACVDGYSQLYEG